jgi:hypothetical protein
LDGVEVYNSGPMTPGMTQSVHLNVSGKQTLVLISGQNGDPMNDHTDWADAKLIRFAGTENRITSALSGYSEQFSYRPAQRDRSINNNTTVVVPLNGNFED